MQLFLSNGYAHQPNEVKLLSQQRREELNPGQIRTGDIVTWELEGYLFAANQQALTLAIRAMEVAYSVDGFEAVFLDNSGFNSAYRIGGVTSRGGSMVKAGPTLVNQYGSDYTNYHTYRITLEAEYDSIFVDIWDFHETLSWVGDGSPEVLWMHNLNAPPQKQITWSQTSFQCVQRGTVVGMFRYVEPPPPIFPQYVKGRLSTREEDSPRRFGPVGRPYHKEYPLRYSYTYEADVPLPGHPNKWTS